MCESIGHRPLRGRCPKKVARVTMSLKRGQGHTIPAPPHTQTQKTNSITTAFSHRCDQWGGVSGASQRTNAASDQWLIKTQLLGVETGPYSRK